MSFYKYPPNHIAMYPFRSTKPDHVSLKRHVRLGNTGSHKMATYDFLRKSISINYILYFSIFYQVSVPEPCLVINPCFIATMPIWQTLKMLQQKTRVEFSSTSILVAPLILQILNQSVLQNSKIVREYGQEIPQSEKKLQTNQWHREAGREEEPHNNHETPG